MLWEKLPDKEIKCKPHQLRVLQYNPISLPTLFTPRPYSRNQIISVRDIFPPNGNICGCGCGKELSGRRSRWATEECENYAVAVRFIVAGATNTISHYMKLYYGWVCSECGCENKGHDMGANGVVSWIKVDHIIPVKLGGGACWLSNYQLLCHDCHVTKTKKDFGWKEKIEMPTLF